MEAVSIILPQKLGVKLREKAEETGYLPEELGVEFVRKGLNEELDPEELVEHYQSLSDRYFKEGEDFLSKGDLLQASEKLWGAVALAVKSVAANEGKKLEKHGGLWGFVENLSRDRKDDDFVKLFHIANSLHRNFYENQMGKRSIEVAMRDLKRFIAKLREGLS
ncbi:MAG: PaREP1 family protein [Methanosarcinales archaeon]